MSFFFLLKKISVRKVRKNIYKGMDEKERSDNEFLRNRGQFRLLSVVTSNVAATHWANWWTDIAVSKPIDRVLV